MKRYLGLFFIVSLSLFGKENLDAMLEQISRNSYEQESHELEKENLEWKKKHIQRRDFQEGLVVSGEYQENHREKAENSYTRKATAQLGPFFVSGYHENEKNGDYTGFGVEKSVKDLFYSKYDSQKKQLSSETAAEEWKYQQNLQGKQIAFVELYRDYQNTFSEWEWNQEERKKLESEEKKLALSYQLGKTKKIDWDAVKLSYDNLGLEIQNLENRLEAYRMQFSKEFRIELSKEKPEEIPMLNFSVKENLEKYKQAVLEEKKEQIAFQEEAVKYSSYNEKMPDMKVKYEHLSSSKQRKEEDVVSLSFSQKLLSDSYDVNLEKNRLKNLKLELKETEAKIMAEQRLKEAEYETYQSKYEIAKNRYSLEQSKYEIKKLEYELGKVDYLAVMEEFDKYLEAKLESNKARNALAAYLYEMMLRSK